MSLNKTEKLSIKDFDQICRLCSSESDLNSLYDNIEMLRMLESCTQMQFSVNDNLPNKICKKCATKIQDTFNFIEKCKIIDETYRKCMDDHFDEQYGETKNEFPLKTKTPEFYTLQWNKSKTKSAVKTSDELTAMRRLQAANRLRCFRAAKQQQVRDSLDETQRHRVRETTGCPTPPERIARDQMRRYRSKLTVEETVAEQRAQLIENMRKYRARLSNEQIDLHRAQVREQMRRYRVTDVRDHVMDSPDDQQSLMRFRSWKRNYECPEDRRFSFKHFCGLQCDEGALRRGQFRPIKTHK